MRVCRRVLEVCWRDVSDKTLVGISLNLQLGLSWAQK